MKKIVVAVAMVMGLGTSVFAQEAGQALQVDSVQTVLAMDEFTPVEVKDLPAAIQEAVAKNEAESKIKEAAVEVKEDGTKVYKVVLVGKDEAETVLLFNENGEVVK